MALPSRSFTLAHTSALFLDWLLPRLGSGGLPSQHVTLRELVGFAVYICRVSVVHGLDDMPSPAFRFRTVGSHIDDWYTENLTGKLVHSLDLGAWRDHWLGEYTAAATQGQIRMGLVPLEWQNRDYLKVEYIYVPVIDEAGQVTEVLTHTHFYLGDCPNAAMRDIDLRAPGKPDIVPFKMND